MRKRDLKLTIMKNGECKICGRKEVYSLGMCRSCYEKDLRARNKEYSQRQRDNSNAWRKEHPEWVRDSAKRRREDPYCVSRDKITKKKSVLRKRGLTCETSQLLFDYQNNCCAICGRPFDTVGAIHLDHDYETEMARGYLCSRCNNGLGMMEESVETLQKAINYLNSPPANKFINKDE